jgi:hypothetical protein
MSVPISSQQTAALGTAAPCQPAKPIVTTPAGPPADVVTAPSVIILDLDKEGWIGIEVVDTLKRPLANEPFILTPPGHDPVKGNLDALGRVRIEGVEPGSTCTITFPNRHRREFVE